MSVSGEIDLLTPSVLRDHLSRRLAAGPPCLVIDLTDTSFLGVTALSGLIDATRTAAQRGTRLQPTTPKRPLPALVLYIAGLNRPCEIVAPATDTDSPHGHPRGHPQRRRLRDQLICGYRPVAEHIARRFAGRGEPLENLIQVASVGLINSIDRFEPTLGSIDDREMLSPLLAQLTPCRRTILTLRFFHELIRRIRRRS